ncbi:hypothetical protein CEXT_326791 [Caerostris extrusa]|uniref:Uncharacterized protein n=1 Tax=Caerostris extrusa TaxID=172846 RepID=A0AAV4R5Y5_CAEEX|nr:hypothetical protein CEXT_326791 [Caerostris extrusa]
MSIFQFSQCWRRRHPKQSGPCPCLSKGIGSRAWTNWQTNQSIMGCDGDSGLGAHTEEHDELFPGIQIEAGTDAPQTPVKVTPDDTPWLLRKKQESVNVTTNLLRHKAQMSAAFRVVVVGRQWLHTGWVK